MNDDECQLVNFDKLSRQFAEQLSLTDQPVRFQQDLGLAFCFREPFRSFAMQLEVGQPLQLKNNELDASIAVQSCCLEPLGFLYATDATWLKLLFQFYQQTVSDTLSSEITIQAMVKHIQKCPCTNRPSDMRRRYPKVGLTLIIQLRHAWPLFTLLTVLHVRDHPADTNTLISQNPWLHPIQMQQQQYQKLGHDGFHLSSLVAQTWMMMTQFQTHETSQ
jgi:hypothetical protein